uniref:Exocyst complex component 2 n=1 Tax=Ditylenchus dipsaci TaxID=166011 RepID=A0A915E8Q1_9BILA
MSKTRLVPLVTGISPHQGVPGTQVTIRGEHLGEDPNDLVALIICGTDCLVSAKWKSSSKLWPAWDRPKEFRVFIEEVGPLQESCVWVDESRTVPGRNVVRTIPETTETEDVLGLKVDLSKKLDHSVLSKMFPEASGNLRMENFNPAWYLLENHKFTKLEDLRVGLRNLQICINKEEETSKNIHKANLNSLINCVDALSDLHLKIDGKIKADKKSWPVTSNLAGKISESRTTADKLFREVLSRKDRADATRNALSVLTRFRFIFFLAESIDDNMAKAEYSTILNDYTRAKSLFRDSEVGLFKEVMAVLDQKINLLKRTIRQKLMDIPTSFEEQSKLIKYLKILDPDSDPAWDCITAYHCWLEDVLWQLQNKYYSLVMEEEKHQQNEGMNLSLMDHNTGGYRHTFITELFALLTEKLQSFWKLSQSYSNSDDEKFQEKQDDIDQMLTNTINVCSWLLLNALVPTSLPESVSKQYKDQFVSWPTITSVAHMNYLFFSLRALRTSIKTLLDFQFNRAHVQPLVELCTTIRLKCLGLVVERASEDILQLGNRENWKMDGGDQTKTSLPDLYETEINEIMMNRKTEALIEPTDQSSKRPNRLFMTGSTVDTMSLSSAGGTETSIPDTKSKAPSLEITSKKLLISICNLEYVINQLLACICRRLTDNGVKFGDLIYKKSKQKLIHYRHSLIKHYIAIKTSAIVAVLDSASYEQLPEEEDVSDFIKELIMCVVFIQAELYLISPQLTNQVLSVAVESSLNGVVIDLAALEEAFQQYLSAQMRSALNSIRARLMNKLDRESFQSSIQNFRQCLRMAIESLQSAEANNEVGYRVGNRNRAVSIIILLWIMVHITLLIYSHLFSFFQAPFTVYKFGGRTEAKAPNGNIRRIRSRSLWLFWIVVLFSHLAYPLYLVDSFEVPSYLYYFSCFINVHWYCADHLVVRQEILPMPHLKMPLSSATANGSAGQPSLQVAVITDLHGGAIVYRDQIAKVVDKVNELNVDAILIVVTQKYAKVQLETDAIDAPRHLIEERMEPLRHLESRYGTYFVTGNHEYYYGDVKQWILLFESYDIKVLQKQVMVKNSLHKKSYTTCSNVDLNGVCLLGLNDISSKNSGIKDHSMNVSALDNCPTESPTLVMVHNPAAANDVVEYAQKTNTQLISLFQAISLVYKKIIVDSLGHTHAGQY